MVIVYSWMLRAARIMPPRPRPPPARSPPGRLDGLQQGFAGKRLGQMVMRADELAARPVEHAVARRQHDHGDGVEARAFLDQGAGLVAVQTRHEDVAEDDVRVQVANLGERLEAVLGQHDLIASLRQEDFRRAADGAGVVDDEHLRGGLAADTGCLAGTGMPPALTPSTDVSILFE
jgi:hypothetical protein